ncbi:hypothetical protein UPYG_G00021200 [Umbra pygmaea]|uniref:Ig-like domain-containing protein n=1 Tax=Umbra pygmaea TaxID=75934 RepID=A0ABD0Y817_UMBPY
MLRMNTYLILLCFLSKALAVKVTTRGDNRVDFNAIASYTCTLNDPTGVLQVTWQRLFLKNNSVENLATYSKRFGAQIVQTHQDKVVFTEASLNSTSIAVMNVSWSDEACYICSFNIYPSGSKQGTPTCLNVQGVSEVRATVLEVPSSEPKGDTDFVVSCTATGKPAPRIQWNNFTAAPIKSKHEWNVVNKDQSVTVMSNITLQLSPGSGGYMDCLVNNGTTTQRQKRVQFPFLPREKIEEGDQTGDSRKSTQIAIPVLLIISLFIVLSCVMLHKKKIFREAALAGPSEEQCPFKCIV